ncbi:MAG: hypothetical protein KA100_04785 [Rickettsiales bacterium]|nr:hypothetical protein [Rickettsiales bacterium]
MKKLKPSSALLIILLAQGNILAHKFHSLQKIDGMKIEKDAKKISLPYSAKQGMASFRDGSKLVVKKVFVSFSDLSEWVFVVPLNLSAAFADAARFEFNKFRLVWFGCCMRAS